ncbi:HPr family phosphocarrier protein [Metabacillus sp. Hm71]|uniref:HPr family phosphocarrier protein n=1 Tax=Metabacillus sp. Hm71 TaxID=3450743 RepID=UPI003F4423B0
MSGIETRAIVEINQAANKFKSSNVLRTSDKNLDVKSILGLSLTLLSSPTYILEIHGTDEKEAKEAMADVYKKHRLVVEIN